MQTTFNINRELKVISSAIQFEHVTDSIAQSIGKHINIIIDLKRHSVIARRHTGERVATLTGNSLAYVANHISSKYDK